MAGLQRPRPPDRRERGDAAARAREVLRDLHVQPRRVLHGPRGRPARPGRRRDRRARPRRAHAEGDHRRHPREGHGAQRPPPALLRARAASPARRARDPDRAHRRGRARGPPGALRALPAPDLPRAHAAGRRPGAPVPVHLQPVAEPRRAAARPDHLAGDLRAHQGPEGDAPALRPRRRGRAHVRPARGRDRAQPVRPLPGDGDRRLRHVSGHPRTDFTVSDEADDLLEAVEAELRAAGASARSCASRSRRA